MSGNRTRVNCLEGSYAHHYTNIAELKVSYHLVIHNLNVNKRAMAMKRVDDNSSMCFEIFHGGLKGVLSNSPRDTQLQQ